MLHVVLHVCCMCVACVLHVCCMCVACVLHVCCMSVCCMSVCCMCVAWQACRIEQSRSQSGAPATHNGQPVHPTTLRNQVAKCQDCRCIPRSTAHFGTYTHAQANKHTHTHTHTNSRRNWSRCFLWHSVVIILAFVCSHGSILLCLFWVRVLQKKQPPHEVPHHRGYVPRVPQFNVVFWILCLAAFKKNSHFCW